MAIPLFYPLDETLENRVQRLREIIFRIIYKMEEEDGGHCGDTEFIPRSDNERSHNSHSAWVTSFETQRCFNYPFSGRDVRV